MMKKDKLIKKFVDVLFVNTKGGTALRWYCFPHAIVDCWLHLSYLGQFSSWLYVTMLEVSSIT